MIDLKDVAVVAVNNIALIVSENRIDVLTELLAEIDEHNYDKVEHVVAHVLRSLGAMNIVREGVQYEIDARADAMSSEQFK